MGQGICPGRWLTDIGENAITNNFRYFLLVLAVAFAILLPLLFLIAALLGSFVVGGLLFEADPDYWRQVIYGGMGGDGFSEKDREHFIGKARAQLRLRGFFILAIPAGIFGLFAAVEFVVSVHRALFGPKAFRKKAPK